MAKKVYVPEAVAQEGVDFLLEKGYEMGHGGDLERSSKLWPVTV